MPSFVVAASGEIELTGIFPSDLKASAFEAIPLGLRFDNAPSGGTFTVTNMFISRVIQRQILRADLDRLLNKMLNLLKILLSRLM